VDEVIPKLLPCPFCGNDAKFIEQFDEYAVGIGYDVGCGTPGCIAQDGLDWIEKRAAIAEMWNRRAEAAS
jgi:hypothetical protein